MSAFFYSKMFDAPNLGSGLKENFLNSGVWAWLAESCLGFSERVNGYWVFFSWVNTAGREAGWEEASYSFLLLFVKNEFLGKSFFYSGDFIP